jgi:hypothetical protein
MANNNFYNKSNKGIQSGVKNNARTNVQRAKGVGESQNQTYGSKASQTSTATMLTHEMIAERAWNIWQDRGRIPGEDERNWHEAENQLKAEFDID